MHQLHPKQEALHRRALHHSQRRWFRRERGCARVLLLSSACRKSHARVLISMTLSRAPPSAARHPILGVGRDADLLRQQVKAWYGASLPQRVYV